MKARTGRRWASLATLSAALLILASTARAAEDEPVDESGVKLPEVVVTAHKVARTLEEVPASVSSIDGEFARKTGAANFVDLQDYTANITMRLSVSAGQYSIRGLGTPDTNTAFDPSVGTVIDGVYYGRSNFLAAFFHDIDRFEVLRGPQGTLFGKNNTAGLINLVTRAPENRFGTTWELLASDYGDFSFRPVISVPVAESMGLRFSGNYAHGDRGKQTNTFLDRPELNTDQNTSRLRFRYAPDKDFTIDVGGFYSEQQQNFNQFQFSVLTPSMRALLATYDPQIETNVDHQNSANLAALEAGLIRGLNATVDSNLGSVWGVEALRLTSITAGAESILDRRDLDADFSPVPFITDTLVVPTRYRQFSQELRVAGEIPELFGWGHGLSFVIGGYYFDSTFKTSDLFKVEDLGAAFAYELAAQGSALDALAPGGLPGTIGGLLAGPLGDILDLLNPLTSPILGQEQSANVMLRQRANDYALFGQAEHLITKNLALIGGLRFDIESKEGDLSSHANGELIPIIAQQEDHQTHIKRREHQLSPKGGLKWEPNKGVFTYATWSKGYKSGGFNALPLTSRNLEYEPEEATSIEIGGKARLLSGAMRVSAAVFSTDFDNLQVSTFQNNSFIVLNAAAARSRGFETDLHWLTPIPGVSLYTSVGFANARYLNYVCAPQASDAPRVDRPECPGEEAPPIPNPLATPPATQDLSGKPLAFAPRWTAALVPAFNTRVAKYVGATLAVDMLYRSESFMNVDNDPRKMQAATTQFNARVSFNDLRKNWNLTFAARNLTDEIVLDQAIDQPLAPGNIALTRSDRGRIYSANLQVVF
jgi:outer membrane receptor protein involved in Fe transport